MRRLGLVGLVCLFVMAGLTATTTSAQAFSLICSGKTKAQVAKCDTSGYAAVMDKMHWRMYAGHNCTNYAAYRMKKAGVPEPRVLMGNARDWHTNARKLGYLVDNRPAVGAIAQWSKASSHVAYVEEVGSKHLILSEDSYTSKVYRRYKVSTGDSWYPERFIHFKDVKAPAAPVPVPVPTPTPEPTPDEPTPEPSPEPTTPPAPAPVAASVSVKGPAKVSTQVEPRITVKVTARRGVVPTGRVKIRRGGKTVKTVTLTAASKGAATVEIPRMKRGKQWISAVYAGSPQVRKGTSRTIKVVVTKAPKVVSAKTTITLPKTTLEAGSTPTARIAVAATDGRIPTNSVSVYLDGRRIAAPVLTKARRGKVTVRLPALTPGKHVLRATYWGSKTVRRSKSRATSVTAMETTTVAATVDRATVRSTEAARVTATVGTVRGGAPTAGEVWVLADGEKVASSILTPASRGTVTVEVPGLAPGARRLSVEYRGAGFQARSSSAELPVIVQERSITGLAVARSVKTTARAKVTVSVHSARSVPVASGKITILDGKKPIATVTLNALTSHKVVVTLPRLAAGTHRLSATFTGTDLMEPSVSVVRTLTVTK
ncbi:hypothetical protein AFL01nite_20310 [Aeromicrobium flavum]|uniref:Peptidase C51 domain-containing protein n=1 Tax=Aeromicrobium flavum TaxID=416568 RepID=A0A512HW77_9ACTN|nr:Ig-like domain repeat protein [Aeromicrobium flavum]GEO89704.1 hypothetical protein AFL01nite_20310 [Aeromicrobium flavum]